MKIIKNYIQDLIVKIVIKKIVFLCLIMEEKENRSQHKRPLINLDITQNIKDKLKLCHMMELYKNVE